MAAQKQDNQLLKNAVGLGGVLFQSITHMAPGVSAAFVIVVGAGYAAGALPLSIIIAIIGCGLTALSISELAKHLPTAGSFYTYASRGIHPAAGFLLGWAYALAEATIFPIGLMFLAVTGAGTFATEFGWAPGLWWPWAIVGAGLVFSLGYYGIKTSAKAGIIIGIFEIAVFLALAVTFIVKAGGHNTLSTFGTSFSDVKGYAGFGGVFAGSVYAITAFVGFEAAAPLAEEAHEPRKTIGRSALYSALGVGAFFVFVTYAATVYFGPQKMADFGAYGGGNPYQQLARDVWSGGWVLIFLALINSSLAVCNAGANATTRTWYAMARIKLLPSALGRVDRKSGSPRVAVLVQLVFTLVVTFWLGFQYDPGTAIGILGALEGLIAMVIFIVINLSCIGFYLRRQGEFNPVKHLLAPLAGVAFFVPAFFTVAGFTVFKFVSPLPSPISYAKTAVAIWMVLGIAYLVYLYRRHPDRLHETKRVFIEDGVEETPPNAGVQAPLVPSPAGETLP